MSDFTTSNGFSVEAFAADIEVAANQQEVISAEIQATPELWAPKGKIAITSLLAEATLSIDRMPKAYVHGGYSLTTRSVSALLHVSSFVSLCPLYDYTQYEGAALIGQTKTSQLPKNLRKAGVNIADPQSSTFHAEHGLGLLTNHAQNPYYSDSHAERIRQGAEHIRQGEAILQNMRLNGTIDPDISTGLAAIRQTGNHTEEEFFSGILELARVTSLAVIRREEILAKHAQPSSVLRRWLRKII